FHAMDGDIKASRSSSSAAWALIEEYGFTLIRGIYAIDVGFAELLGGDLERAEHELRLGLEVMLEIGDTGVQATLDGILGDVLVLQGRLEEALAMAEAARSVSAADDLDAQPRWRAARARALSRQGEQSEATALLREAQALVEPTDFIGLAALVH